MNAGTDSVVETCGRQVSLDGQESDDCIAFFAIRNERVTNVERRMSDRLLERERENVTDDQSNENPKLQ